MLSVSSACVRPSDALLLRRSSAANKFYSFFGRFAAVFSSLQPRLTLRRRTPAAALREPFFPRARIYSREFLWNLILCPDRYYNIVNYTSNTVYCLRVPSLRDRVQ